MKLLAWSLALLFFAPQGDCDLAKTEKGFYCGDCMTVISKDELVSDVVHYSCDGCGSLSKAEGKCDECDKPLTKQTSDKDVCPECLEKPEAADLCVKTFYECPDCSAQANDAGSCRDCKTDLEHQTSKVLIEYECSDCGDSDRKAGKCSDSSCPRKGKPMLKRCTESGEFPHGGEPN